MPPDFLTPERKKKKKKVGGKIYSEKKIIANNIKIFRACYMPSK